MARNPCFLLVLSCRALCCWKTACCVGQWFASAKWWGESSSSQVCFLLWLWGRVQAVRSAWARCGERSLPARSPQACREDTCQTGLWVFSSLFDADEAVCGAATAGVGSAVLHLTHLVQWNKWPGSECCFTVAESQSPNNSAVWC